MTKPTVVRYYSNNSGGAWWLELRHWKKLERAGWSVAWQEREFLGAMAMSASRVGLTLEQAKLEWEITVGMDPDAEGCECCGPPHEFVEED